MKASINRELHIVYVYSYVRLRRVLREVKTGEKRSRRLLLFALSVLIQGINQHFWDQYRLPETLLESIP